MDKNEEEFITYEDLLQQLKESKEEKNLLLGNGFNISLGVKTSYKNIFQKMQENNPLYKDYKEADQDKYDIEKIMGKLKKRTEDDFVKKLIEIKIKKDFMESVNKIVENNIKHIYQENNESIYYLLKNFENYFSLNYDPLLYLLMMKFKKQDSNSENGKVLLFPQNIKSQYKNFNTQEEEKIYQIIKEDYDKGEILFVNDKINMNKLTLSTFISLVKEHLKKRYKKVKQKTIEKLCKQLLQEERGSFDIKEQDKLSLNDGFNKDKNSKDMVYVKNSCQNLFFLHGTFYLYNKSKSNEIYKITYKQYKALYQRLEDIIDSKSEDIVCIFKDKNKLEDIKANNYLNDAYNKLKTLKGTIVILGCSLSKNDSHIFEAIKESKIKQVYIACFKKDIKDIKKIKDSYFKDKYITLFDSETISYSKS